MLKVINEQHFFMANYSIILPAHNEEDGIRKVLQEAQKSQATEIIVIDDGSVDHTADIVISYQRKDQRIKLFRHKINQGYCAARRKGTELSSTDNLIYYDCDIKTVNVSHFDKLAAPLLRNESDYVFGSFLGKGRVTEYLARPLLRYFLPKLAQYTQPLSGLVGIKKKFTFPELMEERYANLGIVLNAYFAGARFNEIDLGEILHDKRADSEKYEQATQECEVFFDILFDKLKKKNKSKITSSSLHVALINKPFSNMKFDI